mgnify:CR=1 FL=1
MCVVIVALCERGSVALCVACVKVWECVIVCVAVLPLGVVRLVVARLCRLVGSARVACVLELNGCACAGTVDCRIC